MASSVKTTISVPSDTVDFTAVIRSGMTRNQA